MHYTYHLVLSEMFPSLILLHARSNLTLLYTQNKSTFARPKRDANIGFHTAKKTVLNNYTKENSGKQVATQRDFWWLSFVAFTFFNLTLPC